jgi:deoxyribonuclease V
MKIRNLHNWNVTAKEAVALQQKLRSQLILGNSHIPRSIKTVAGADISYARGSDLFFAVVLVLAYPGMEIIEEASFSERVTFPYIPGLLSFREGPPLLRAFEKIRHAPDVVIFDGQGISHPRGIGLASHLGLFLDVPTIGCAKKRLVGENEEVGIHAGAFANLRIGNETIGAVVRTKSNVRPVYISPGHKINLKKAVSLALSCCLGYRLPEPVRKAHMAVNQLRVECKN